MPRLSVAVAGFCSVVPIQRKKREKSSIAGWMNAREITMTPDDRTQAQRHEQDHARIYVPGCGYCRERALTVNGPGTKVRDDNASTAPEDGGHENINSH